MWKTRKALSPRTSMLAGWKRLVVGVEDQSSGLYFGLDCAVAEHHGGQSIAGLNAINPALKPRPHVPITGPGNGSKERHQEAGRAPQRGDAHLPRVPLGPLSSPSNGGSATRTRGRSRRPECEWRGGGVYAQAQIDRYDRLLDEGARAVAVDLRADAKEHEARGRGRRARPRRSPAGRLLGLRSLLKLFSRPVGVALGTGSVPRVSRNTTWCWPSLAMICAIGFISAGS